ncbi:MAG TPA: guanylate kinase [Thermoleophilaceae bacterium]|nr:guanylate kinase [Thermoleophilaceae bacterium]
MSTPVLVITGPSGVGKGTLIRRLLGDFAGAELSVSATTREPRDGEVNGRDYHFLSSSEFEQRVRQGEFVEHAEYAGNRYGTLRSELQRPARLIVLEIDLQGARQVRTTMPEARQVFIAPPDNDLGELERRLVARGAESSDQIERRLAVAREELAAQDEFRHRIVNADADEAAQELIDLAATMCVPEVRNEP